MNLDMKRKQQAKILSAADHKTKGLPQLNTEKLLAKGPELIDCLTRKWHRTDLITVMGASGSGKTSFNLYCFKSILENNPEGICIFIATEMTIAQIITKWDKLTGHNPELSQRLYIVASFDDEGNGIDLSIEGIRNILKRYQIVLNKPILSVVLDHLNNVPLNGNTLDHVTTGFGRLAKEHNFLAFLNAQTSKERGGQGDIPLDKNAPYMTSKPTQDSVYMISISQPLKRIQDQVDFPVTAWSYAKIRFKERTDTVKETINYLLMFEYETEGYRELSVEEKYQFREYYQQVVEMRKEEDKNKTHLYDTSFKIKGKNGKEVKVQNVSHHIPSEWD